MTRLLSMVAKEPMKTRQQNGFALTALAVLVAVILLVPVAAQVMLPHRHATSQVRYDPWLASYWPLDELSGTRYDLIGGFPLYDTNSVSSLTGVIGRCADFDQLLLQNLGTTGTNFLTGDTDFAVTFWFNLKYTGPVQTNIQYIVGRAAAPQDLEFLAYFNQSVLEPQWPAIIWNVGDGTHFSGKLSTNISFDTWYFFYGYHDSTNNVVGFSLDDGNINTTNYTYGSWASTAPLTVGGITAGSYERHASVLVDDLRLWKRLLTSSEVQDYYDYGNGRRDYATNWWYGSLPVFPDSKLVSYWRMDETSGTRADAWGTNTLSSSNNVGYATGVFTNAAAFSAASSQSLYVPLNDSLEIGTNNFTFGCWLKLTTVPASGGAMFIAGQYDAAANKRAWVMYYANTAGTYSLQFAVSTNGTSTVNAIRNGGLSTNTWYYVAGWCDIYNQQIGVQVNNNLETTAIFNGTNIYDSDAPITLGNYYPGVGSSYLNGAIDEATFWKRKLDTSEITALSAFHP